MYKRIATKKLGRTTAHRKSLMHNQLRSLVQVGKIKTTTPKAKVVKGELESLISKVRTTKDGDLNLRKRLQIVFGNAVLVKKFIENSKKESTKVTLKKIGFRDGDNAEMSVIEMKGIKVKDIKKTDKVKEEKKVVEEVKPEVEVKPKKGLLNLRGNKPMVKSVTPVKKERAKSRSGL